MMSLPSEMLDQPRYQVLAREAGRRAETGAGLPFLLCSLDSQVYAIVA
jgi:hypothetical protein